MSEESLLKELNKTFGHEAFRSDLQKRAVATVYGGMLRVHDASIKQ